MQRKLGTPEDEEQNTPSQPLTQTSSASADVGYAGARVGAGTHREIASRPIDHLRTSVVSEGCGIRTHRKCDRLAAQSPQHRGEKIDARTAVCRCTENASSTCLLRAASERVVEYAQPRTWLWRIKVKPHSASSATTQFAMEMPPRRLPVLPANVIDFEQA